MEERWLTADADGSTKVEKNWLREEDLSGVDAELTDLGLRELHLFPSFPFQKPSYHIIQHPLVHHPLHCHHHHLLLVKPKKQRNKQTREEEDK